MSKNASSIVKNTKWVYIAKIFAQVFNFISVILVVRNIEVSVFGTYNLLLNTFFIFQILGLSAIINIFNRYIPEIVEHQRKKQLLRLVNTGYKIAFLLLVVLVIALVLFQDAFVEVFKVENFNQFIIALICYIVANFMKVLIDTILKSVLLHKKVALTTMFVIFMRTILYIVFIDSLTVELLLYIEAGLFGFYSIYGYSIFIRYLKNLKFDKPTAEIKDPVTYKRIKKYGLYSIINEFGLGLVGNKFNYFIVSAFTNPILLGIFAFASRINKLIFKLLPFKDFQSIIRPIFYKKFTGNYKLEEFHNNFAFMIKILLPIYVFPIVFFILFGQDMINFVFGDEYISSYALIVILLSTNFFVAFFYPLGLTAYLKERMDYLLYSKIAVLVSIFIAIVGVKYYGLYAVVLAYFFGSLVKNLVLWFFMRRYKEIKYRFNDYKNFIVIFLCLIPWGVILYYDISIVWNLVLAIAFVLYSLIVFINFLPYNEYDLNVLEKLGGSMGKKKRIASLVVKTYRYLKFR